jgi:hypothetical protein
MIKRISRRVGKGTEKTEKYMKEIKKRNKGCE